MTTARDMLFVIFNILINELVICVHQSLGCQRRAFNDLFDTLKVNVSRIIGKINARVCGIKGGLISIKQMLDLCHQ